MKHTLITFVAMLSCICGFAQPIDSFYRQGSSWVNIYHWTFTSSTPPHKATDYVEGYRLHIGEDTVVNSITYKKMYCTSLGLFEATAGYPYRVTGKITQYNTPPEYIGRIRIDGRKVYFTDEGASQQFLGIEYIMYDFSGKTGDTVERRMYPQKVVITKTDSIQLNTGEYVKRYYYNGDTTYTIIEGLGTRLGTPADMRTIVGLKPAVRDYVTVCYSSGNISYRFPVSMEMYDWYLAYTCFDLNTLGVATTPKAHALSIYPNPSRGQFTIAGNVTGEAVKITVYNAMGQLMHSSTKQVSGNTINAQVALNNVPAGVYHVIVSIGDGQQVLRMVVE